MPSRAATHLRLAAAAAALALAAPVARAGGNDLDLSRLGSPAPGPWLALGAPTQADAERLAAASRRRFTLLAGQLAGLASGPLLQPAATTGALGLEAGLLVALQEIEPGAAGEGLPGQPPPSSWPSAGAPPGSLASAGLEVRKALPWSVELGGRLAAVEGSGMLAGQLAVKWAFLEGLPPAPDLAVRVAASRLEGVRSLRLSTLDLDLIASRPFGVGAGLRLVPWGAARLTLAEASSAPVAFVPDPDQALPPDQLAAGQASFPRTTLWVARVAAGARLDLGWGLLAAEVAWVVGGEGGASGDPRASVPHTASGGLLAAFSF